MSASALIDLALSSFIFAFPRKYIIDNYLKVRKLIKSTFKSKKSNTESDNLAENQDGTSLTPELDAKFKEACKVVERSSFLSHQQLIHLYGLYKQALMGDCTRPKPSQSDIFEYRKWQAWDERRGLSKEDAKSMYIKLVEDFMPNFMNKAQGQGNEDEDDIFMTDEEYNSRKGGKRSLGAALSKFSMVIEGEDQHTEVTEDESVKKFFELITEENLFELEEMIKNGYDLMQENASGTKAIHFAIDNDKEEAFRFLLPYYTDINIKDRSGMTPLHYAVLIENENMIRELIQKNADIYIEDNNGETPFGTANSKIKKILTGEL